MNGFNRIFLLGRVGKKPELVESEAGDVYANLSVASNRYTKAGNNQTEWFWVRVWGKQAENCQRYLQKGQGVLVEGYLNSYKKDPENIQSETRIGINALKVEFLPHKPPIQ